MPKKLMPFLLIILFSISTITSQQLPLLKISSDHQYITKENGAPFFWLGGTAWELIHRLDKKEVELYLKDRKEKGFTVIQTVILAELSGLVTPNVFGDLPLQNNDPTKINEKYFEHIDFVIEAAEQNGLYVGLLPTWGDKFNKKWGEGPEIFTPRNAAEYSKILAERYKDRTNIIWILGGDRIPENENHLMIIQAMGKTLKENSPKQLITYHPSGGSLASDYINENWLDLDMYQSGHSRITQEFQYVLRSKAKPNLRPVINGEARYENIPDRFWEEGNNYGWLDDSDVRVSAYWTMLSGAAGYTYGCNDIWQMYSIDKIPSINARTGWKAAMDLPGSLQMKFMKELFEVFPWQQMTYSPNLILGDNQGDESYITCAISKKKDFLIAYTPVGKSIALNLSGFSSEGAKAYWYNPRSGKIRLISNFSISDQHVFTPWAKGRGSDFVLVIVASNSEYNVELLNNN
ncbi:MAG: glycoside hydrolase family 140 protein [Melioribacteraceae bacterium]|nr:glycoside hydrolase family 140 protein [Melioribacteraceae bacterium]MCF8264484.1 glycoside hydrolase family 140 protein [Melioribacteraceae bacterium]